MTAHQSAYALGIERTIRTRIRARGYGTAQAVYGTAQAVYGLAWANEHGFATVDEGLSLAMSRILLSDEALADGARWSA